MTTLPVVSSVPKSPSVAKMFVEVAVPKYPMPLTVSAVVEAYEVVRRESALSKVNADELASCPELVAKTTRPPVRPDTFWSVVVAVLAYRFVEVNAVDDAYGNVLLPVAVEVMAPAILRAPPKVLVPVVVNAPATVDDACETKPLESVAKDETASVEPKTPAPVAVKAPATVLLACETNPLVKVPRPVKVLAPVTPSVEESVAAPVTPKVPLRVPLPAASVVAKRLVEVAVVEYRFVAVSAVVEAYLAVRRDSTESKVRADESANVPLDVAKVRRPSVRPETESAVVEALVAVRRAFAESKVNADESVSCPAVVAKGTRPEVRDEIRMFVVLADVKSPFVAVNGYFTSASTTN